MHILHQGETSVYSIPNECSASFYLSIFSYDELTDALTLKIQKNSYLELSRCEHQANMLGNMMGFEVQRPEGGGRREKIRAPILFSLWFGIHIEI